MLPDYVIKVVWRGFEFVLITGLPEDCNTLDLRQVCIGMIDMDWFMFSYSYEAKNANRDENEGLMSYINRAANRNYYDPARGDVLMKMGYKYEQCALIGFMDELPDFMQSISMMPELWGMTKGRTALIGIAKDDQQRKFFDVMPWLRVEKKAIVPELLKLNVHK